MAQVEKDVMRSKKYRWMTNDYYLCLCLNHLKLLYNITLSSRLALLYLMFVADVYVFVFMYDCLMTFYDCLAMAH